MNKDDTIMYSYEEYSPDECSTCDRCDQLVPEDFLNTKTIGDEYYHYCEECWND